MKRYLPETLCMMVDMSRNAVMSVPQVKTYMGYLKKMGYNAMMLYTEDTYEVEGEPYFGYMRGGYTCEDLRELDAYAASMGMELIPCIQTLAHLQCFVHWEQAPVDRDDILLVDDPRTYELVERMIRSVRSCFRSNRIHIGMDEAWALGRGKYMDKHGYESGYSIMKKHLDRVCEIVRKYDLQPMIWSDMFFYSLPPARTYYIPRTEMPEEIRRAIPDDVSPVYWDYYHEDEQSYDDMLSNHEQLSDKTWYAGSAWSTHGFLPLNRFSVGTVRPALDACRKHRVKNLLLTSWGDDGNECSRYALMPSIYFFAEYARGNTDEEKIKKGFRRLFGAEYEDFMSLDELNELLEGVSVRNGAAPKAVLYSDLFNGFLDVRVRPERVEHIRRTAEHWHACAKKYRKWHYLFDTAARLADVLAIKYDLGIRTRNAYQAGDREALRSLAENEYAELLRRLRGFLRAFEKQWNTENKPVGFDVQELRIGGTVTRIESCRRRLLDYAKGRIDEIPELAVQPVGDCIPYGSYKTYGKIVTPHRLTHRI